MKLNVGQTRKDPQLLIPSSTIQHDSQFILKIFTSVLQQLHRPRNTVTVTPPSAERFEPKIRPILKTTPPPALPKFESKKIDYDRSPKQKVRDLILNIPQHSIVEGIILKILLFHWIKFLLKALKYIYKFKKIK